MSLQQSRGEDDDDDDAWKYTLDPHSGFCLLEFGSLFSQNMWRIRERLQRFRVSEGQCCLRVAASPYCPFSPITQLSPSLTRNRCRSKLFAA